MLRKAPTFFRTHLIYYRQWITIMVKLASYYLHYYTPVTNLMSITSLSFNEKDTKNKWD